MAVRALQVGCAAALLLLFAAPAARAEPGESFLQGLKIGVHGIYMEPIAGDARDYSTSGWGAGIEMLAPVPAAGNLIAGVLGFELVNLLDDTVTLYEPGTLLRVEQQTSQDYMRVYLGPRLGPHGHGFLRPYVGTNLAVAIYGISTDVVVPDDTDRELEIRQNLRSKTHSAFAWDFGGGVDLNFFDKVTVEVGLRYLKSFNVPQQLGDGSVTIYPQYFQVTVGIGIIPSGFGNQALGEP